MAKAKMKQVVIPKFSSEAEEAAWWDRHRSEIEVEIRRQMRERKPLTLGSSLQGGRPSQPVTLRVPKEDLEGGVPDLYQDAAPGGSGKGCVKGQGGACWRGLVFQSRG